MMLTRDFQKTLITKAQSIKPVVQIGSNGLTEAVHEEVEIQLAKHELIKIKINANDREAFKNMASELTDKHQALCVQMIGRTLVLYRENEED